MIYSLCALQKIVPVRMYSESARFNRELFLKQCIDLIERRGHWRIRLGEGRVQKNGTKVFFDITYGWPIRYYCKCNFSSDPVQTADIKAFEKTLRNCGIIPTTGIYFSLAPFVKDDCDFDVRCIDSDTYKELYESATKNKILKGVLFGCIVMAFYLLVWAATHEQNIRKKKLQKKVQTRLATRKGNGASCENYSCFQKT